MEQIQAAEHAFAAIRSDGRVVTWGHGDFAPEESHQELLQDVYLGSSVVPTGRAHMGMMLDDPVITH